MIPTSENEFCQSVREKHEPGEEVGAAEAGGHHRSTLRERPEEVWGQRGSGGHEGCWPAGATTRNW